MEKLTTKPSTVISTLLCATIGHDFIVSRKVTNHIMEYSCYNCGREVTTNQVGKIELLTYKTRQINTSLAAFFQKRSNRISA
jgi:DNA-directed RNA polymerase subunit RPC12/RpoP